MAHRVGSRVARHLPLQVSGIDLNVERGFRLIVKRRRAVYRVAFSSLLAFPSR